MKPSHLLEGRLGERIACRFLMGKGFDIVARRFQCRSGEVDIIAFDAELLVFVEVKTRASRTYGDPTEFVDWEKQQRFRRTAEEFVGRYDLGQYACRFDIVSVVGPGRPGQEIFHFPNAF